MQKLIESLKQTIAVKNVKTSEIAENVSLKRDGGRRDL